MQVRDVLFISDLIAAYDSGVEHIDQASGKAYNIGGGPDHTLSLLELIHAMREEFGYELDYSFDKWRAGDQLVYISDIRSAGQDLRWAPAVSVNEGLRRLVEWLQQHRHVFSPKQNLEGAAYAGGSTPSV